MRTTSAKLTVTITKYAPRTLNESLPIRYPQRPATADRLRTPPAPATVLDERVADTSTLNPTAASALA